MSRVYILERGSNLPPLAFSSFAKAKAAVRTRFPFVGTWKGPYLETGRRRRGASWWIAEGENGTSACITSVKLDRV